MPEIRPRDSSGEVGEIHPVIAQVAARNKFLQFRDGLTLAYTEDYANLEGIGGKRHAVVSGIRLIILDYSNDETKLVSATIPCWQIDKIYEVCKAALLNNMPYSYHQDRVNPHKQSKGGFYHVSSCSIQRNPEKDGQPNKWPWAVNISNFEAKPIEHNNGTISYQPDTKRNETKLFIGFSDDDMWRAAYSCQHFIAAWEQAFAIDLVRTGKALHEQQIEEYRKQLAEGQTSQTNHVPATSGSPSPSPSSSKTAANASGSKKAPKRDCNKCQLRVNGSCPQLGNYPCDDFRAIPEIPPSERENWPAYGDATTFRLGGHRT